VILVAVLLGLDLPLSPVQILWANMVTAVTLSLALAYEPSEPGLMRRPPRRPGAPILGEHALWRIAFVSPLIGGATIGVFLYEEHRGYSFEMAQTMAVNTPVLGQVFYLFNSRFLRESSLRFDLLFTNRVVWIAIAILVVLQLMFVYVPFLKLVVPFSSNPCRRLAVADRYRVSHLPGSRGREGDTAEKKALAGKQASGISGNRFENRRQIASYTGLCPGIHYSNGRGLEGSINRCSNSVVRYTLIEMVWRMLRYQPDYPPIRKLRSMISKRGKRRLVVAAARRLAIDLWRWATGRASAERLGLALPPQP